MTSEFTIAVHSLVLLRRRQTTLSSEAIAENVCTNPARIRKVMARLKKAGLVETKEGIDGGYHFIEKTPSITLNRVAEALEETFVSSSWKSGNTCMECLISSGMAQILTDIYQDMNALCYSYLAGITIEDIEQRIFEQTT